MTESRCEVEKVDTAEGERLTVRLLEKNDENIEELIRIDGEAFEYPLFNKWVLPPFLRYGRAFGLFQNGSMIGFTLFLRSWGQLDVAYMEAIAVDREHQGRGCSQHLLSESLRRLREDDINHVLLTVDPNNSRALHIYQDLFGFRMVELRKEEYGKGKDRFLLKLDLEERCKGDR